MVLIPHRALLSIFSTALYFGPGGVDSWCFLTDRGFRYGIGVSVVGITSYVLLFAALPSVAPIVEALGKDITGHRFGLALCNWDTTSTEENLVSVPRGLIHWAEGEG